jgi:hypothetical protein
MVSTEKDIWPVLPSSKFNTATTAGGVYWNKLRKDWQYDLPPPPPEPVPDIWPVSTSGHTCTAYEASSMMVSTEKYSMSVSPTKSEKHSKPISFTKVDKAPSVMASLSRT